MIDNPADPLDRICNGHLVADISRWAVDACRLGELTHFEINYVGYDDCNLLLATTTGDYFAKVFTAARSDEMCQRYVGVLDAVVRAGIAHPRLRPSGGGQLLLTHEASGNHLVVMDAVRGSTFFDLGAYPADADLRCVMDQVHRIHALDIEPPEVYDWWAIPRIVSLGEEMLPRLPGPDRPYVRDAMTAFAGLDRKALPLVFSHGDLTKTNVMRNIGGGISIIDFAVSNRYPRVHDLAMVSVNLMDGHPLPVRQRTLRLTERYSRVAALTAQEMAALPVYVFAAAAMELLGAYREWLVKGNRSAETRYLLDLGRRTVRAAAI
ncbi:MAG TPA: phosphotransferase [Streptosporangiaceae bacterium]|nr:phosphotransferase [Streptosporangiaceae bacterium]